MHELSLARSLLAQSSELAATHGGALRRVRVQVGPLSGVEPALMVSAWERSVAAANLSGAMLEIEEVPLVAHCRRCEESFQPVGFSFRCPACGGASTEAVSGDGVVLHSIVIDDERQEAAL